MHKSIKNLSNKKFHQWSVLDSFIKDEKTKKIKWKCVCDCGITKYVFGADLISGKSKRCHNCGVISANNSKNEIPLTNTFWNKYKTGAKVRSLEFNITKIYAYQVFLDQNKKCKYTNLELCFNSSTTKTDGTASLDRIDSSKGYIKGNIQWVHKKINTIKMDLSHNDFIKMCHLVSLNTNKPENFDLDKCFKPKNTTYYNKRNKCDCGNLKLKTSNKCKECYNINL